MRFVLLAVFLASILGVTSAFGDTQSLEKVAVPPPTERALQYHKTTTLLWCAMTLWSFTVPILLLATGFSARLKSFSCRIGHNAVLAGAIYFAALTAIFLLLNLPLDFARGYICAHWFGLSNQTFADWGGDWTKMLFVSAAAASALGWIPFWLVRKSPRRWWIFGGLASIPIVVIFLLIKPLWIDPLFDKFGPMQDKVLEQKILELASRANIEGSRVFDVNKSEETKAVNAYVTGFLHSKRIVLWDTAISKLEEDELLFVLGHEMGHFVLGHMMQIVVGSCIAIFAGLFFIHKTAEKLLERFKNRFGFDRMSDIAAAPLFVLLFQIAMFALTPAFLAISRFNEAEADRFGLELTRNNHAAATGFVELQRENLGIPYRGTFYKLWRGSHPDLGDRIEFANKYRPWATNGPLQYDHLFRNSP